MADNEGNEIELKELSAPKCKISKIVLVSGKGSKAKEVVEACWTITSYVNALTERDKSKFIGDMQVVVNSTKSLANVAEEDVDKIHQYLYEMHECQGRITCILIGHSHGAKVLNEALAEQKLSSFLKKKYGEEKRSDIADKIKRIRKHLAVFTLGGIQDVNIGSARIAVNLHMKGDIFSTVGKVLYSKGDGGEAYVVHIGEKKYFGIQKKSALSLFNQSAASSGKFRHYLFHYLNERDDETRPVMDILAALLKLETDDEKLPCPCQSVPRN